MTSFNAPTLTANLELLRYRDCRKIGDVPGAWLALERAHILAQPRLAMHVRVHWAMLGFAIAQGDRTEALGQLLRLLLAPIGNVTGRLPLGNTGRARVSAFAPMALPADLRKAMTKDERT